MCYNEGWESRPVGRFLGIVCLLDSTIGSTDLLKRSFCLIYMRIDKELNQ